MVNRLLHENRKTIPKFLSGKKLLKEYNAPDFKFYPSMLTDKLIKNFHIWCNVKFSLLFVLFDALQPETKLTLHHMRKIFTILFTKIKFKIWWGYIFEEKFFTIEKNWDGLPFFSQETIYHVSTEMRQSLVLLSTVMLNH